MNQLDETVKELREKLAKAGATFLLVYAAPNVLTDTVDTRITSNSSQQGVRAILNYILRPTGEALKLLAHGFEQSARAAVGIGNAALDQARDEQAFATAAKSMFEAIRPHMTVVGWDTEQTKPS